MEWRCERCDAVQEVEAPHCAACGADRSWRRGLAHPDYWPGASPPKPALPIPRPLARARVRMVLAVVVLLVLGLLVGVYVAGS